MRRRGLAAAAAGVAALAVLAVPAVAAGAQPAAAAPGLPERGVLVPGRSLGGVRLGMTAAQVRALLGSRYGRCAGCARETWYFQQRLHAPMGLGVELQRGRVSAVFTLWSPPGWHTSGGIRMGASGERLGEAFPGLDFQECLVASGYDALVLRRPGVQTVFMLLGGKVWGFMLLPARAPVCR